MRDYRTSVVLVVYWVHGPTQVYIYISRGVFSDRLEPKAADAKFVSSIEMVESVPKVTWSPDFGAERVYWVLGAKGLGSAAAETARGTGLLCCSVLAVLRLERGGCFLGGTGRVGGAASLV